MHIDDQIALLDKIACVVHIEPHVLEQQMKEFGVPADMAEYLAGQPYSVCDGDILSFYYFYAMSATAFKRELKAAVASLLFEDCHGLI